MPGCTAPNCTNSSQKGFKLYHFPTDRERNLIWVQNCGRERGWKPTRHTCVCEVHFDDSQFESHRADGLRKLKPYAIPTIFNHSSTQRAKRTKKIFIEGSVQDTGLSLFRHSDDEDGVDNPDSIFEIQEYNQAEQISEPVIIKVAPLVKKRKRGRPAKVKDEDADDWTPNKVRAVRGRKRGRPSNAYKNSLLVPPPSRNPGNVSKRGRRKWSAPERSVGKNKIDENEKFLHPKDGDQKSEEHCYVCNKPVEEGTSLHTRTATTKVFLYQKLTKVVAVELGEMVIEEEEVLCSHCTRLLNYMDRIEVELNMLNKAILNCMRRKFGMGVNNDDKTHEADLLDLEEQQDSLSELNRLNFSHGFKDQELQEDSGALDHRWEEEEEEDEVPHPENEEVDISKKTNVHNVDKHKSEQSVDVKEPLPVEEFQCRVCMYKTVHKSVFIFHLRQHLKDNFRCDFCSLSLPLDSYRNSGNRLESCLVEHVSGTKDVLVHTEVISWKVDE